MMAHAAVAASIMSGTETVAKEDVCGGCFGRNAAADMERVGRGRSSGSSAKIKCRSWIFSTISRASSANVAH